MFREKISDIKIGKKAQFPKSVSGEYILAIDNKLVYTDGRFVKPSVSRIVELYVGDETVTDMARQMIFVGEKKGTDFDGIQELVESCFGEGSILVDIREDERGNARKAGRGERENRRKVREDHHGDLSSAEEGRRFALKTESENKAHVERMWYACGFLMPGMAVTRAGIVYSNFDEMQTEMGFMKNRGQPLTVMRIVGCPYLVR